MSLTLREKYLKDIYDISDAYILHNLLNQIKAIKWNISQIK